MCANMSNDNLERYDFFLNCVIISGRGRDCYFWLNITHYTWIGRIEDRQENGTSEQGLYYFSITRDGAIISTFISWFGRESLEGYPSKLYSSKCLVQAGGNWRWRLIYGDTLHITRNMVYLHTIIISLWIWYGCC